MVDPQKEGGDDVVVAASTVISQDALADSSTDSNNGDVTQRAHPPEFPPKHDRVHIEKTNPELKQVVHDIQSSEDRLDHYVARLQEDKTALLKQINKLEEQLNIAKNSGLPEETVRRLETLQREAQDKLKMLSGAVPENILSRDRAAMQKIVKKWHEYDQVRTNQAIAENKFNKNPEDKRAEGDINRARTAAYALNQEISSLVKQSEGAIAGNTPDQTLDQGIAYSREQSIADAEARAQKKTPQPFAETAQEPAKKPIIKSVQPFDEAALKETAPATPEVDLDPVVWEDLHPEIEEPALPEQIAVVENVPTIPTPAPIIEKVPIAPIQEPEPLPISAVESVPQTEGFAKEQPAAVPAPEVQPVQLENKKEEVVVPPTPPAPPQPISVPEPEAKPASPFTPTPEPEIIAPTMPQDIMPSDPQALAYADTQIHNHLDILFGKKGFWGMGITKGVDSPHWKDALYGFADKPVAEILAAEPEALTEQKGTVVGIKNRAQLEKMQDYIMLALSETGVHPGTGEKAEDYLKRAAAITIGRFMENEKVKPQL